MSKIDFLHFGDGVAEIKGDPYRYQEKTIGISRNYSARSVGVQLEKMIAVPYRAEVMSARFLSINSVNYKIEQAQVISDSRPKSIQLSLSRTSRQVK